MPNEVRGVVARAKGEPVSVETIYIPDPGPGEVVVDVEACGVYHTDLHYREGAINNEFPFLLGHEAAGRVSQIGAGVCNVEEGDFVVLNWRAVCGNCRSCLLGRPQYCFATHNATQQMTSAGEALALAPGIGAFAEQTLIAAGQATKVNENADPEVAGLIGCGVMAGLGAALNTGNVTRGDSVAVWGCGGVGNAAIEGSRLAGAHTINSRQMTTEEVVSAVQAITGGNGVDVAIEAVGHPEAYKQASFARDLAGTLVLVGVPNPEVRIDLPMVEVFGRGGSLKSSWYGDCLPSRDFPMLIDLYLQGRLDLERFVSEKIGIEGVEEAFNRMERGEVLRSVVMI